jgi:hypothetical protein
MSINLASIANQLQPGLMAVTGKYKEVPLEFSSIFVKKTSILNMERSSQARFLGIGQLKADGGATQFDNMAGDRYTYNMQPINAGLGYVMTRNTLADGLYKDVFTPSNLGLQNSMRNFWNTQAAYLFNAASTYNPLIGGDGVALLSTSHPVDTGTWANTSSTPQSLSESSLLAAIKAIPKTFVDQAGLFIDVMAKDLLVPWALRDVALRLTETELRPGTANNDLNIIPILHGGKPRLVTSRFLTSDYAWFLTTSVNGFIHLEREPFETDMFVDFDTDNLKVKCFERAGFFYNDPRAVYGMMATA